MMMCHCGAQRWASYSIEHHLDADDDHDAADDDDDGCAHDSRHGVGVGCNHLPGAITTVISSHSARRILLLRMGN